MNEDMLVQLFNMQIKLNDQIFEKKNLRAKNGERLESFHLMLNGSIGESGPNSITNEWLGKFLMALEDECRELKDELLWKWWSKDTLNMQNIRVEIVDILHFWISLCITAGMSPEDVFRIYMQKNEVNLKRNASNYSKANKIDDNKEIK